MKIMIVSHYLPPHVGGIEQVAMAQARRLAAAGHQVELVSTAAGAHVGTGTQSGQPRAGLRIRRLAAWNGIERRTAVPFPVPTPFALLAMLRRASRADVVHVHDLLYPTSWLGALAAVLTKTPVVLTQHVGLVAHPSRLVRAVQRLVYDTAGRRIVARAARIAYLNGAVAQFLRTLGAGEEQLVFAPNAVDTATFRPAGPGERTALRAEFGLPADETLVLFAGRFVPKKGFDIAVAAADPGFRLVLAGGTLPDDEASVAARPGVSVLGRRSRRDLARLYRACDVFVLPSQTEGFPLTVAEAMASGLAVVTSDDPGYQPYALDRAGVALVQPTVQAVRAALLELSTDAERRRRMGDRARTHAVRQFAPEAELARLSGLYDAALAPTRATAPVRLPEPGATHSAGTGAGRVGAEVHHVAA